jgi:acyl dehydratase
MPTFAAVNVGDELPALSKQPERLQLVQYAAGSGDFNPLHYDADFPQARQIGDNIVHGRLKYATLGECVSNWLGHSGWIASIGCQYRGMDLRGAPFTVKGVVRAKREEGGRKLVDLDVWTEDAKGNKTTPGTATVVLRS